MVHSAYSGISRLITQTVVFGCFFFKSVWEETGKVKVNRLHLLSGQLAFLATAMPRKPIKRWQARRQMAYHLQCANIRGCWQSNWKGVSLLNVACCNLHSSPPSRCEGHEWEWRGNGSAGDTEANCMVLNSLTINSANWRNRDAQWSDCCLSPTWLRFSSAAFWNSTKNSMPKFSWSFCAQALSASQQWGVGHWTLETAGRRRSPGNQSTTHRASCLLGESFITDLYPQAFFFFSF